MKEEVRQIIGKTITGVVIKEHGELWGAPRSQLFLVFDDGTHYEFYSHSGFISPTGGVREGGMEDALAYMDERLRTVWVGEKEKEEV